MNLTIDLDERLGARLQEEAHRHGVPASEYARRLIEGNFPAARPAVPNRAMLELLAEWDREDETDDPAEIARRQREVEELKQALNNNRASGRKPFP